MEVVGYLAGGLCVLCLVALAVLGGRVVRFAVAAFVLVVVLAYGLFLVWLGLYGD
jgi:hypothetical protein